MTRTIQILRGTEAQNDAFTGAIGELTMDTTNNEIRIHDGSTVGGHKIAGGRQTMPLLSFMWADHQLNDVSWLRADTFSWQSGAVYQAAYQHLADDIDGKTLQSETVGGVTVQFYLADDGHKICPDSQESNVASIFAATGVAWYYIIDTVNQRFKLPQVNSDKVVLGSDAPVNITSNGYVFTLKAGSNVYTPTSNANAGTAGITTATTAPNTSVSVQNLGNRVGEYNSGLSATADLTQTNGYFCGKKYLYFYVGNFTQTALENTAGITTEEMNNKVNIGHEVIEFQEPTAANNYTWYRKYADGWVEQGGIVVGNPVTITFPIVMANSNYTAVSSPNGEVSNNYVAFGQYNHSTTGFQIKYNGDLSSATSVCWQVSGMAA